MKKRDLTKLALMGIAIGLCGGQIQADDDMGFDDQNLLAACSSCQATPGNYGNSNAQPVNQPANQPQQYQQTNTQQPQQRPMGQGKQMTKQGGYLLSEAPPMPEDHPASDSTKKPSGPQKVAPTSNNMNGQARPTADANSNYSNSGCGGSAPAPKNMSNPQQKTQNQQYPTNR